jgi:AbrB family looped-hinge helix DNA binding protein
MRRDAAVVRVSSRGQIVIPAALRRRLRLRTGQRLTVRAGDGREVVFVPVEDVAADVEDMLRRARQWSARTRRDLVDELHRRRKMEREREPERLARRGD